MNSQDMQISLDDGLKTLSVTAKVIEELEDLGLHMPTRPEYHDPNTGEDFCGQLPAQLADLDDQALYQELEKQTKWGNYVNGELAKAESYLAEAKAKEELAKAKIRLSYRNDGAGGKRTEAEAKVLTECDRYYTNVRMEVLKANARFTYIQAIMKNADDGYGVISRRITQRGQEVDRDRRTIAVGGIKAPGVSRPPSSTPHGRFK